MSERYRRSIVARRNLGKAKTGQHESAIRRLSQVATVE